MGGWRGIGTLDGGGHISPVLVMILRDWNSGIMAVRGICARGEVRYMWSVCCGLRLKAVLVSCFKAQGIVDAENRSDSSALVVCLIP